MHGRPLAISPDHYDTHFPSAEPVPSFSSRSSNHSASHPNPHQIDTSPPSPPAVLRTPESITSPSSTERTQSDTLGVTDEHTSDTDDREDGGRRTYEGHIALFRLATILGDIMEDAVRLKPVDYKRVMTHDEALESWHEMLPASLKISPTQIAQNLASFATGPRRQGVQALVIRMAALHIRFTLHRPYATRVASMASPAFTRVYGDVPVNDNGSSNAQCPQNKDARMFSLMIALEAAKELIELVAVAAPGVSISLSA